MGLSSLSFAKLSFTCFGALVRVWENQATRIGIGPHIAGNSNC